MHGLLFSLLAVQRQGTWLTYDVEVQCLGVPRLEELLLQQVGLALLPISWALAGKQKR